MKNKTLRYATDMPRKNSPSFFLVLCCCCCMVFCLPGKEALAQQDTAAQIFAPSPFLGVESPRRVTLLVPEENRFWKMLADYARAAAEDLGLRLRVQETGKNPELFLRWLTDVCRSGVDGVIFQPPESRGEDALRIVERNQVPCFLINARIPRIHFYPRTKYDQWLGNMVSSNEQAGAMLLRALMASALRKGVESFNILALGGGRDSPAFAGRRKGLENALMRQSSVRKFATVNAGGNPQQAAALFWKHFKRDPEINMVWCASDAMALAVADTAARRVPGAGLVIGGIGWDRGALQAVREGTLQASVGGQFFEGAWAVILMNDYLSGLDFAGEGVSFTSPLFVADARNAELFDSFLEISPDAIDFRRFAKIYNPLRQAYRFDLFELAAPLQKSLRRAR